MIDVSRWPALVLTAGLATRLRPLSDVRAKAAMPVAGTAIVARIVAWLRRHGVRRIVLNLHHKPESITAIVGDGSQWGVEARYSWEPTVLGSGGGPRRALALLESDRFFIINGDTLTDCDLAAVAARHLDTGAAVTMGVVAGDTDRYGGALVDEGGRIRGFGRNAARMRPRHFIGVQAVDAAVFSALPDDQPIETVRMLYPQLIGRGGIISAYESGAEFLDVGTARDYLSTVATVAARENKPYDVGRDCTIASDAHLERSIVWDRVSIGAAARLVNCVVADDVVVADGARYADSVLVRTSSGTTAAPL